MLPPRNGGADDASLGGMTQTVHARAVLLDMDGTLVDSTAAVERIWLAWAKPHGLDPEHVLSVIHGRQGHQSMAILLPERDHAINIAENASMLANEAKDVDGVIAIAGADVSKPDPEGFLLGAKTLGVDPADCVVFEDSGAGIQAAHAAGMRVIGVGAHAVAHDPEYHVTDLTQVAVVATDGGFELAVG